MTQVWDWLVCWIIWAVKSMTSIIVDAFKLVLTVLATAANAAIALLPDAAMDRPTVESSIIGQMNYFLPIAPLAAQALILIAAWGLYRLYRYLFGWVG